jgi:hypothetical protein
MNGYGDTYRQYQSTTIIGIPFVYGFYPNNTVSENIDKADNKKK